MLEKNLYRWKVPKVCVGTHSGSLAKARLHFPGKIPQALVRTDCCRAES